MLSKKISFLCGAFVAIVTFAVFSPVLGFEFVNWDDTVYVLQNPHFQPLTWMSGLWFFIHTYFRSWNPITMLSHMLDLKFWHYDPFGHHFTNLLLHSVNAGLVLWIALHILDAFRLRSIDRDEQSEEAPTSGSFSLVAGSVVAALVFSLHPLRAESAAWISDRKDLLCTFFMLLASIIYFTRREDPNRTLSNKWLIVFFYLFAIGSKSIAVVLPFAFMLIDAVLFKYSFKENVRDKIPLLVLAVATAVVAKIAAPGLERDFLVGDTTTLQLIAFPFTVVLFYLQKFLVPLDLSPVYHPNAFLPSASGLMLAVAPVVVVAITVMCYLRWKQGRTHWLVAWSVFVLFLAPTFLGLYSGIQPIADRYTYAASISLAVLAGGGVERFLRQQAKGKPSGKSLGLLAGCAVILVLFAYQSLRQVHVWKNSSTLWTYVLARAPYPVAYNNLGIVMMETGKHEEALRMFESAIAAQPSYGEAMCNLGIVYNKLGNREKAIDLYRKAIEVEPTFLNSYINLGTEYLDRGMMDSAIATYRRSLIVDSMFAPAYYNIALARMKEGKYMEAVGDLERAVSYAPANADAWYNLGVARENLSQTQEAVVAYTKAIAFNAAYGDAYLNLANIHAAKQEFEPAIQLLNKAISVNPKSADAYYNLGTILFLKNDAPKALAAFQLAIEIDSTYAKAYHNSGIVYAQAGDEPNALASFQHAARLGNQESQEVLRSRGFSW